MPGQALARVRGVPNVPSITELNVRQGPGTNRDVAFKIPVGASGQLILDVQPDVENRDLEGKIYQWFKLEFDGGAVGWMRDDLLEVQGDLTAFGYPDLPELTYAFALTRDVAQTAGPSAGPAVAAEPGVEETAAPETTPVWTPPGPTTEPLMPAVPATGDFPDAFADTERVRKAAFQMAAAFEGGFGAINTYDAGIVSYGFLQFTLAAGSLGTVLQNYTSRSESETADKLRGYLERVINRDALLKDDQNFLNLLREAANEQAMIDAQDEVGEQGYWKAVVDGYIVQRQLKYPLTWALLFDMGVNFGVNHGFVRLAERELGVEPRSNPAETGLTEEQLMTYVAQLRKRSHDRQAARDNLPGLSRRGDFWMSLVAAGDWYLRGDASGNVYPNGRTVNIR